MAEPGRKGFSKKFGVRRDANEGGILAGRAGGGGIRPSEQQSITPNCAEKMPRMAEHGRKGFSKKNVLVLGAKRRSILCEAAR